MKTCFDCKHFAVCMYAKYILMNPNGTFPFINDSKIEPYLKGMFTVMAEACNYFMKGN